MKGVGHYMATPRRALFGPSPRLRHGCRQVNPLVFFDLQLGRYGDAVKLGRVVMVRRQSLLSAAHV